MFTVITSLVCAAAISFLAYGWARHENSLLIRIAGLVGWSLLICYNLLRPYESTEVIRDTALPLGIILLMGAIICQFARNMRSKQNENLCE